MADPFIGEIRPAGFNFAPRGWALCEGSLLSISQNTALFSLLGTTFGGNGTSNFALPNLADSIAIGFGQGSGLTPRDMGETGGSAYVALLDSELPAHHHSASGSTDAATTTSPVGGAPAVTVRPFYGAPANSLGSNAFTSTGGGTVHNNFMPTLGVTFIIALSGVFPPRS